MGDNSHAKRIVADTIAGLKQVQQVFNAAASGSGVNTRFIQRTVRDAVKQGTAAVAKAISANIKNITTNIGSTSVGKRQIQYTFRQAVRAINTGITSYIQNVVASMPANTAGSRSITAQIRKAVRPLLRAITQVVGNVAVAAAANIASSVPYVGMVRRLLLATVRQVLRLLVQGISASLLAASSGNQYRAFARTFHAAMQRLMRQYMANANASLTNFPPFRNRRRGSAGGGGGGGGGMMGARADMFMHTGALQNMVSMGKDFLTPYAEVENATIQMRAYAGSAEAAKKVVEEMQQFAIQSPYKLEGVLEATSIMMKYGQSAENAMELTRMLGDVAGGNTDKLKSLGLAVGQATGFGRLQGQELRQMVNAGFNPLKTAARELAGGKGVATDEDIEKQMDFLLTAMRKRQLDSDIIKAALEVETAKGGDFAGVTAEQAKSLTGWANQFLETLDLIKIQITETFADDLKKGLETVVRYTTATVGWMKANKEVVKQYVLLGIQILKYVVGFHLLGAALATTKWLLGSLMLLFAPLRLAIQAVTASIALLRSGMVLAWIAAIGPIGWLIIAIAGIGLAIAAVRNERGFWGLATDAMTAFGYLLGFMYNFGHNISAIFDFIANNWGLMIIDGILAPLYMLYDPIMWLANTIAYAFGTQIPDSVLNLTENLRKQMADIAGIRAEYDTSMFKFDGPNMTDMLGVDKIKEALKPFLPPDIDSTLKDKPDIDFKKFVKGAGEGEAADPAKLREHAVLGSADHAMRMYQYGQDQAAMMKTEEKKNPNQKMEDLLGRIERNTRGSTLPLDGNIEEAALV
jgi:hypothetical protein